MLLLKILLSFLTISVSLAINTCDSLCISEGNALDIDSCYKDCLRSLQAVTEAPTNPTETPTESPTKNPTESPTKFPTENPTLNPTIMPTDNPTFSPTTEEPFYEEYLYFISAGGGVCLVALAVCSCFCVKRICVMREERLFKLDELKPIKTAEYLPENVQSTDDPETPVPGFRSPQQSAMVRMGITSVPEKFRRAKDAMKLWMSDKTTNTEDVDHDETEVDGNIEVENTDQVEASFRAPMTSTASSGIWGRMSSNFRRKKITRTSKNQRGRREKKKSKLVSLEMFDLSKSKRNQIDYSLAPAMGARPNSNVTIMTEDL